VTALNKIDALDEDERAEALAALEAAVGGKVYMMSGVSREGLNEVLRAVRAEIDDDRIRQKPVEEQDPWRP
jgi:GTP-binding protein